MVSRVAAVTRLRQLLQSQLTVGTVLPAVVRWVSDEKGALCDIGGLTGLLPRSRMGIAGQPTLQLPRGTKLKVGIAEIREEEGETRITLDAIMPWAQQWDALVGRVKVGQRYAGTVKRIDPTAVIVNLHLADGLEAVIRSRTPLPVTLGDRIRVRITEIHSERRTIYGRFLNRIAEGR